MKQNEMEQSMTAIQMIEHPDSVLLRFNGTIDVFVAADLYATAIQLASMGKDVNVVCAQTEGFDASAVQILLALQTELRVREKRLVMIDVSPPVEKWIVQSGLANILLSSREERAS